MAVGAKRRPLRIEDSMRHCLPASPGSVGAHDVSIREALQPGAFASVSTISISPPHSGQIAWHWSSVTGTASPSGAILAVSASWIAGPGSFCAAAGSNWRMRASFACRLPLARKP